MKIFSKRFSAAVLVVLTLALVSGCKDKGGDDDGNPSTPVTPATENGMTFTSSGSLTVNIAHSFKEQALQLSPQQYVTDANDTIKVTEVTYYITNITLTNKQGQKVNLGNANLVEFAPPTPNTFTINNIPAGTYTSISYLIGVDSTRNSSGAQEGDLDPNHGMFWTWNTGYVFARLKGRFSAAESSYSFDIGGTPNIMSTSHSLTAYKKSGTSANMYLNMDMSKVFNSPNLYDLKVEVSEIHTPTSPAIQKMKPNIAGAFTLKGLN